MKTYRLGQKITCSIMYKRVSEYRNHPTDELAWKIHWKVWIQKAIKKQKVMVIGIRTLSNGVSHWNGDGEGVSYEAKEFFKALLVVRTINSKPFLIPIE